MSYTNTGNSTFTGIKKQREDSSRVIATGIRTKSLLVEDNIKIEDNAEIIGNLTVSGACDIDDTLNVTNNIEQYGYTFSLMDKALWIFPIQHSAQLVVNKITLFLLMKFPPIPTPPIPMPLLLV